MSDVPVYIINLNNREDRWNNIKNVMENVGIKKYKRFEAVNGKELSDDYLKQILSVRSLRNLGRIRRDHYGIYTKGAVGCYLSHIEIYKEMIKNNIPEMIIFEDDACIKKGNTDFISFFQKTKKECEEICRKENKPLTFIFFDHLVRSKRKISDNIIELGDFFGTMAYYVTLQGAIFMLEKAFPIELQVDAYLHYYAAINRKILLLGTTKLFFGRARMGTDIQTKCIGCDLTVGSKEASVKFYCVIFLFCLIFLIVLASCYLTMKMI